MDRTTQITQIKNTMVATKIDDFSLSVVQQPSTPDPITTTYDRSFLEQQLIDIQKQLDDYTSARQAELDNVNALLALCDDNGIIAQPASPADPLQAII